MSLKQEKALVVFSGGQDSTTCLYWALKQFLKVEAVTFAYGQKHAGEIDRAREICAELDLEWTLLDMFLLNKLAPSALTRCDQEVPTKVEEGTIPTTFVPGRNLLFLSFAAVLAHGKGIRHLITGVCETDSSGYPDCRDGFVKATNLAISQALESKFMIHTPLMWLDKAGVWEMADELGVLEKIRKETLTCYNGVIGDGCGKCQACFLRQRGLEQYLASKNTKI